MTEYVCAECGSHGEGGEVEYADGTRAHERDISAWKDGKHHPIMCSGQFVKKGEAVLMIGGAK